MTKETVTDLYMGSDGVWYTIEELQQHERGEILGKPPLSQIEFAKQILRILIP